MKYVISAMIGSLFTIGIVLIWSAFKDIKRYEDPTIIQSMVRIKYSQDSALWTRVDFHGEQKNRDIWAIENQNMPTGLYPPEAWYVKEITDSVKQAHYKLAERLKQ
jgi:hypothetical protein